MTTPPSPPSAGELAPEITSRIEDVAAGLFSTTGYAGTTVDHIAHAAGLSKPALYRHFVSKKHLYLVLLERHGHELAATALGAATEVDTASVDAQLHAMVDAWFGYVGSHPFVWLLFGETTGDPDVATLHRELRRRQRAADVALLRRFGPDIPEAELEPLGEAIRSSLYGLALLWRDQPDLERSVLVAAMMRLVRGLVALGG